MTRICRLIAGIQLHTGAWTVDQAASCSSAGASAAAGGAAGGRARHLRSDLRRLLPGQARGAEAARRLAAAEGAAFDLRRFHERVMTNGIAPWWAHRQLLLPGDSGAVVE